jgi:hypothetical protein
MSTEPKPTPEIKRIKLPPGSAPPKQFTGEGPRMLPGMAMIAIFMLFIALANSVNVIVHRAVTRTSAMYAILIVSTFIVVGVFGFLRLRRWGWALLMGGCFFYSLGNVTLFIQTHQPGYLLPAAFAMVFFLYLVRTEIRERVS